MPRSLSTQEISKVLTHARTTLHTGSFGQKRDVLAVTLGLLGLRIGEIVQLNRTDLRTGTDGRHFLHVRTLKGGLQRLVPIADGLFDHLRAVRTYSHAKPLLQVNGGGRTNTRNLRRSWDKMRELIGLDHARFHDLRHTAAMQAWEKSGHNLFVVSALLGHRKIENTRHYLATVGAIEKAVIEFDLGPVRTASQPSHSWLVDDDGSEITV